MCIIIFFASLYLVDLSRLNPPYSFFLEMSVFVQYYIEREREEKNRKRERDESGSPKNAMHKEGKKKNIYRLDGT